MKMIVVSALLLLTGFGPLARGAEPPPPSAKSSKPEGPAKSEDERKKWPTTLDDAASRTLAMMSEANKKALRSTPFDDLLKFHNSLGATIRNTFGLWRGNRPLLADCNAKNPDEASMVILEEVWARLQKDSK